jgi:hypothetical protein
MASVNQKQTDTSAANLPAVTRAVQAEGGQTFYEVTMGARNMWISATELVRSEKTVLGNLAENGIVLNSPQAQAHLRREVQAQTTFEKAVVVSQPGWAGTALYVYPDGTYDPPDLDEQLFIGFDTNPDYHKLESHFRWQRGAGPFVEGRPHLLFFLMYALMPILLTKLRLPIFSPALEIVGGHQFGKSTILHLMGSIHGGNAAATDGLARSADFTKLSYKQLQRQTNDNLLLLDETNIADSAVTSSLSILFLQTSTDERARFGDTARKLPVRNAVAFTGNRALEDHDKVTPEVLAAARTRLITYRMAGAVFAKPPEDYATNGGACAALKTHCNEYYGSASRKFVAKIIEQSADPKALADKLEDLMRAFKARVEQAGEAEGRLTDVFALTYAAGELAKDWKVFPKNWPDPMDAALEVFGYLFGQGGAATLSKRHSPSVRKLLKIIESAQSNLVEVKTSSSSTTSFADPSTVGYFTRSTGDDIWLFLDPSKIKGIGANTDLLKALRDEGVLVGEAGKSPKLQSHAPRYIPLEGRAYKFVLAKADLPKDMFRKKRRRKFPKIRIR